MSFTDGFIKILDAVCGKVGIVIDWTSDMVTNNILPYISELTSRIINYEIITSVVWMLIWGIVFFLGKKVKKTAEKWDEENKDSYDDYSILWIIGIAISIFAVVFALTEVFDIATALTLPEKTLIDFTKNLME